MSAFYWRNKSEIDEKAREYYKFNKLFKQYASDIELIETKLGKKLSFSEKRDIILNMMNDISE